MTDRQQQPQSPRVGVEIEFSGIELEQALAVMQDRLQAASRQISPYEYEIYCPQHKQPFRLEVDFELLKQMGKDDEQSPQALRKPVLEVLEAAAAIATPLELVTPPIGRNEVAPLDGHLQALAAAGAVGTQDSFAYAFGTHFNPELLDLSAQTIRQHLQAFLCLFVWLKARDDIDLTRLLTRFADPFTSDYEELVLDPKYQPDLQTLMTDYLEHNPTRNRALDMLPLFSHIDASLVRSHVDDERVKARPTFHYRLPNCRLGSDDWSLLQPWQDWQVVETVAADQQLLENLMTTRKAHIDSEGWLQQDQQWAAQCQEILDQALENVASRL